MLNEHQTRVLERIVDEIDAHREGQSSAVAMFSNLWGLISAAELGRTREGAEVEALYYAASTADDARQAWIPKEHRTSDADFDVALENLRKWALNAGRDR